MMRSDYKIFQDLVPTDNKPYPQICSIPIIIFKEQQKYAKFKENKHVFSYFDEKDEEVIKFWRNYRWSIEELENTRPQGHFVKVEDMNKNLKRSYGFNYDTLQYHKNILESLRLYFQKRLFPKPKIPNLLNSSSTLDYDKVNEDLNRIKNDYLSKKPFHVFKCKFKDCGQEYLTWQELRFHFKNNPLCASKKENRAVTQDQKGYDNAFRFVRRLTSEENIIWQEEYRINLSDDKEKERAWKEHEKNKRDEEDDIMAGLSKEEIQKIMVDAQKDIMKNAKEKAKEELGVEGEELDPWDESYKFGTGKSQALRLTAEDRYKYELLGKAGFGKDIHEVNRKLINLGFNMMSNHNQSGVGGNTMFTGNNEMNDIMKQTFMKQLESGSSGSKGFNPQDMISQMMAFKMMNMMMQDMGGNTPVNNPLVNNELAEIKRLMLEKDATHQRALEEAERRRQYDEAQRKDKEREETIRREINDLRLNQNKSGIEEYKHILSLQQSKDSELEKIRMQMQDRERVHTNQLFQQQIDMVREQARMRTGKDDNHPLVKNVMSLLEEDMHNNLKKRLSDKSEKAEDPNAYMKEIGSKAIEVLPDLISAFKSRGNSQAPQHPPMYSNDVGYGAYDDVYSPPQAPYYPMNQQVPPSSQVPMGQSQQYNGSVQPASVMNKHSGDPLIPDYAAKRKFAESQDNDYQASQKRVMESQSDDDDDDDEPPQRGLPPQSR